MRAALLALALVLGATHGTAHAQASLDPREVARTEADAREAIAPPAPRYPGGVTLAPLTAHDPLAIGGGPALTLDEVLDAVEAHHPALDALDARVGSAEGALLAAEGGFDPLLASRGYATAFGYYQYGRFDVSVTQATPLWGISVFAGWRIGRGFNRDIPDYYRYDETLDGGELRGGVVIPLLRDGWIDARRATITRSERGVEAAEQELAARRLRVQLAATEAFTRWVAAGMKARIAEDLLALAEERDAQIASRVASGLVPAIEHLENRRAVLERRTALVSAGRALERAAIPLSLYYRDDTGAPRVVPHGRVPDALVRPEAAPLDEASAIAAALGARPELARLRAQLDAARVAVELAENQVLPRLDVTLSGSGDLGSTADADRAYQYGRPTAEGIVSLQFPLALREGRGRLDAAQADRRALEADAELARDTIAIEVRDALSAVAAAERSVRLATESAEVAQAVAAAERARFDAGATTLFVVNQRETAAAQARATLVDAEADLVLAHALYRAATGAGR